MSRHAIVFETLLLVNLLAHWAGSGERDRQESGSSALRGECFGTLKARIAAKSRGRRVPLLSVRQDVTIQNCQLAPVVRVPNGIWSLAAPGGKRL